MAGTQYDIANYYWVVGGNPEQVWSSDRMMYVASSDDVYQQWLSDGNSVSSNPTAADMNIAMQEIALPVVFAATGLTVTCVSNILVNGTYRLDQKTVDQIGTVARDIGAGLGLPLNAPAFQYPDSEGVPHIMFSQNVISLYKAMRDYIANFTYAVQARVLGADADLPSTVVTID